MAGKNLFAIKGDAGQFLDWNKMGLKISIKAESLPPDETCEIAVAVFIAGKYKFPETSNIVSAIYAIATSKPLLKPMELYMQHCVALKPHHDKRTMTFIVSNVGQHEEPPYNFSMAPGGQFFAENEDGTFPYQHSDVHLICIANIPKLTAGP